MSDGRAARHWLAWALMANIMPFERVALIEGFGSPEEALTWLRKGRSSPPIRISAKRLAVIQAAMQGFSWSHVERECGWVERMNGRILTPEDAQYPAALATLADRPCALWVKGSLEILESPFLLAVVGARNVSSYGLMVTHGLVSPLAKRGCIVVSGGARGVDAQAHRSCLRVGGRTLAVLGSGLGRLYPADHRDLFEMISENGLVMTEFSYEQRAYPHHFPQRNRLIAGLGRGLLVTEAAERSGSLITARYALEQGKEVMSVPGPIHARGAQGTNRLLAQGAHVVCAPRDIAQILGWSFPEPGGRTEEIGSLHQLCLQVMGESEVSRQNLFERLRVKTHGSLADFASVLLDLERQDLVIALLGDRFMRTLQGSEMAWQRP